MPGQTVIASDSFAAGLRSEFLNTYRSKFQSNMARLSTIMRVGIPSTRNEEDHFYWESAPHPRRRDKGEPVPSKPFDGVRFTVPNVNWSRAVEWFRQDLQDDQTRSLESFARQAGENFALLEERVAFQLITGATDAQLLASIPNAPDGAALYSTTDGSAANRFGVVGGNIVSGSGIATAGAVRGDFFNGIERALQFQDTEGQPLWDQSLIESNVTVCFNVANMHVFQEAFIQARTVAAVGAAAADGLTNVIMDSGLQITLWPTQRITNNDWNLFFSGPEHRTLFSQEREGLQTNTQLKSNSDLARKTDVEGVYWEARKGFGIALPINTIQINN